jgi:cytoskeletal protein CcmA (bactofilin family)
MRPFLKKQPPIRSLIGEGTVVHGEVRFEEGLRIDGEVHGDVHALGEGAQSLLVISEKARVHGKVKGGHVIINGMVIGPVEMHQGAAIDGEVRTIKPSEERPALKLAAASQM